MGSGNKFQTWILIIPDNEQLETFAKDGGYRWSPSTYAGPHVYTAMIYSLLFFSECLQQMQDQQY